MNQMHDKMTYRLLYVLIQCHVAPVNSQLLADLLQLITRSSMPHPVSQLISYVYDFKAWMEPYLAAIVGHSKYLAFRFTLNATSGKAEMHYKRFSSNAWEPEHVGVSVLTVSSAL